MSTKQLCERDIRRWPSCYWQENATKALPVPQPGATYNRVLAGTVPNASAEHVDMLEATHERSAPP